MIEEMDRALLITIQKNIEVGSGNNSYPADQQVLCKIYCDAINYTLTKLAIKGGGVYSDYLKKIHSTYGLLGIEKEFIKEDGTFVDLESVDKFIHNKFMCKCKYNSMLLLQIANEVSVLNDYKKGLENNDK